MDVYQRHYGVFNQTLASATLFAASVQRVSVLISSTPAVDDVNNASFSVIKKCQID